MSNVSEEWLEEWLKDVKSVITWTGMQSVLNGDTIESYLEKLKINDEEFINTKLTREFPAILLIICGEGDTLWNKNKGKVMGVIKATGIDQEKSAASGKPLLIDKENIFYINPEKAVDYRDTSKKWWKEPLKKNRDCYVYSGTKTEGSLAKEKSSYSEKGIKEDLKNYIINTSAQRITTSSAARFTSSLSDTRQCIFYGPPGTGKTRRAKIEAVRIVKENPELPEEEALNFFNKKTSEDASREHREQIRIVQFHPGYSYNDFMETIDMTKKGYADRIFKEFAEKASQNKEKRYVLIIDEINRANVSEVLGELLYGIEYRGVGITTEISGSSFSVPENLYIIGTMNTADRSLQNLDYAVRRRFTFEKFKSGETQIRNKKLKKAFNTVRNDIEASVARGIDPEDIMPGVSYFIVKQKAEGDYDEEHFKYKMKYELIPLLNEYAKDGMFTKRKKIDDNLSLTEFLHEERYYERICESLKEESQSGQE